MKNKLTKILSVVLVGLICIGSILCVGCKNKDNKTTTTAVNNYIHVRWANQIPVNDSQMNASGGSYMGVYYGISPTAPTSYTKYTWVRIKGEDGAATATNGVDGKDGKDGADGQNGLSAYEIAVKNGFGGTEQEWLESLKGQDGQNAIGQNGENGLSAYEIAVNNGYIGTEQDWLESLKGQDGKDGVDGQDGVGVNAHIDSIAPSAGINRYNIKMIVDRSGDSVYMLKLYCNTYATPTDITLDWVNCSPVNSMASTNRYYVLSGDLTEPNSQVVLMVPIAPYYKNYFEKDSELWVRITNIDVEMGQLEIAAY